MNWHPNFWLKLIDLKISNLLIKLSEKGRNWYSVFFGGICSTFYLPPPFVIQSLSLSFSIVRSIQTKHTERKCTHIWRVRPGFDPVHFIIIIIILLHSSCKRIGRSQTTTKNSDRPFRLKWFFPEISVYMRVHVRLNECDGVSEWGRVRELSNQFFVNTSNEFLNVDCNLLLFVHEMRKCTPCSFLAEL